MNYFLPIHCGSPDMANKQKINLNKWFTSIRNFTYSTNRSLAPVPCSLQRREGATQGEKGLLLTLRVRGQPNKNLNKYTGQYLQNYLAGLIEGDGYISITNQNRVILGITFNIKDRPLAEKLLNILGKGSIVKRSKNSIELRFSSKKTLCNIIELINGKFRTPKIDQLYKLIDWMNKQHSMDIKKLPLNDSSILNDSWLSGFIDADGNFYIRNSLKQIICKFALEQRMIYPKTNESYNFILNKICLALNIKLHSRNREGQKDSYYIIRVENQNSIKLLIDYLNIYPLLSSKHLDFLCWKIVFNEIINKNHMTVEGRKIVSEQKGQMNDSRTLFNWDHLNFYNAVYFRKKI
jgi:hypothetical protein